MTKQDQNIGRSNKWEQRKRQVTNDEVPQKKKVVEEKKVKR